jgi:hypothetical protein
VRPRHRVHRRSLQPEGKTLPDKGKIRLPRSTKGLYDGLRKLMRQRAAPRNTASGKRSNGFVACCAFLENHDEQRIAYTFVAAGKSTFRLRLRPPPWPADP